MGDSRRAAAVVASCAGVILSATLAGWAGTQGTFVMAAAVGAGVFAAALTIPFSLAPAVLVPYARIIAWVGVIAPLTFSEQHTAADVLQQGATRTTYAQAAIAVSSLLIVLVVARPALLPLRRYEPWLAVYAGVALVSTTWSVAATPTLLKALQLLVSYLLVLALVRLTEPIVLIRQAFVVFQCVVFSTIVGLMLSPNQAFAPNTLNVPRLRGALIQVSPDLLGVVAAVACVWTLAQIGPHWTRIRWVMVSLASLDLALLLLSRSRTGVGALAIGLIVLALAGRRRVLSLLLMPVAALIVAGVIAGNVGGTVSYLQRDQSSTDLTTLTGRTNNWSEAFSLWKHHPVQGFGYYAGHRLAAVSALTNRAPQNLDNMWIETLQNLGFLGIVPLGVFVVLSGLAIWRPRPPSSGLTALRSAYAALLFASFLNPSLQKPSYVMVLFLIVLLVNPDAIPARLADDLSGSIPDSQPLTGTV